MRNTVIAIAISLLASALLYLLTIQLGLSADIAKGVAGLPAFTVKNIYEFLEMRSAKSNLQENRQKSIATIDDFALNFLTVLLISSIMVIGMVLGTGAIFGWLVQLGGYNLQYDILHEDPRLFSYLTVMTSIPLRIVAMVHIGRWIGFRSNKYGYIIVIASSLLGAIGAFVCSIGMMTPKMFDEIVGGPKTISAILQQFATILPDIVIYSIVGSIGFRMGARRRLPRYLGFVLRLLPVDTQRTIVDITREEAEKATASRALVRS